MDAEAQALYGLPLAEFTPARDALSKERTRGGDKAAAAAVKALRKPSVIAWALNQLARQAPGDVAALLEAGDRVRQAQTAALEGDPSQLREASREEGVLVNGLADRALAILAEAGNAATPAQGERLAATLRAAATDAAAGESLRQGILTTELSPAGFGFDDLAEAVVPAPAPAGRRARREPIRRAEEPRDDPRGAREAEAASARARRQVEAQVRRLEAEAERAEDRGARLGEEAERAEERARVARAQAEEAVERAKALRAEAAALAPGASKGREG